jgi:hypothetical protein
VPLISREAREGQIGIIITDLSRKPTAEANDRVQHAVGDRT